MSSNEAQPNPRLTYFKAAIAYYFQPKSRSFIAALYFIFFLYFALFYASGLLLVIRFIYSTVFSFSTVSQGPQNVVWGAIFVINLLAPFFISLIAILIPYEMRKKAWPRSTRIVLAVLFGMILFNLILFTDFSLSYVEKQTPIKTFLEARNIPLKQ